jgi:Tfp pilus assembly protein FimT
MLEVVVVLGIIAILAVMAVPALMSIVPTAQLRGSARSVVSLMQQARLMAENSQKPVRVSIDCRAPATVCRARLHIAVFNSDGTLDGDSWAEINDARRDLAREVGLAAAANAPASVQIANNPANLYWAVFMPSGRARSSHEPFRVVFSRPGAAGRTWELAVNRESGRASLQRLQ